MINDPFMKNLIARDNQEKTLGSRFGKLLLEVTIPVISIKVGYVAFLHVAYGKDPKFDSGFALPVGIIAGGVVAVVLLAWAIAMSPKNRERFAIILSVVVMILVALELF